MSKLITFDELLKLYAAGERDFSSIKIRYISRRSMNRINLSDAIFGNQTFDYISCLSNINFRNANLTNVDFAECLIENTDFSYANLSGASFWGSVLSGSNFTGATLINVDFRQASWINAIFIKANLTGSKDFYPGSGAICSQTILPNGKMWNT